MVQKTSRASRHLSIVVVEDASQSFTALDIAVHIDRYTLAIDQLLFSVNNSEPQASAELYYHLGMAYYRKGDQTLALQTLRKALELEDSFAGADEARRALKEIG